MARVKDMLEAQKKIIHTLWEAGKAQNEDSWPGGILSACPLKGNKTNLFKKGSTAIPNLRHQQEMNVE